MPEDACSVVRAAAESGALDERFADHVERCTRCAEHLERGSPAPPGELRGLALTIDRELDVRAPTLDPHDWLARVRALPTRVRAALALGAGLAIAAACMAVHTRPDLATTPKLGLALLVASLTAIFGLGALAATRPLHRPAWASGSLVLVLGAALVVPIAHAITPHPEGGHAASMAICVTVGLIAGSVAAIAVRALARGPFGPSLGMGMAAVAAGVSNLGLCLFCGTGTALHLGLAHAGVATVFVVGLGVLPALRARNR